MDVLYIIGKGSKHDNIELRMSLRSIEKYADNLGGVIVVGYPPSWLSPKVVTLTVADKYKYKHPNIFNCIETAVDKGLVNGEFLYSSDDHFYVKSVDFDNYPYFIKGELRQTVLPIDPFYNYHKSLLDTRHLCEKFNLPTQNYSQHCNTHMHADIIKEILPIIHESYKLQYGAEPTSLIMNKWMTRKDAPFLTRRKDLKIRVAKSVQDIYTQVGDRDCFSIGDKIFANKAILQFFQKEYPNKSSFES